MWPNMKIKTVSYSLMRRLFSENSKEYTGIDLLTLEKVQSPAKKELHCDFLYGIHPVSCALEARRRTIETVFYRRDLVDHNQRIKEILERCWAENIPTKAVTQTKIDSMTEKVKSHQGLLAKTSRLYCLPTQCTHQYITELTEKEPSKQQVWLFLNEIQDPMNFGSILRSAYFLGCDKVFVSRNKSCPLTPVVSKASSGVMELMPIHSVYDTIEFCQILKEFKWDVVGTGSPVNSKFSDNPDNTSCVPVSSFRLKNSTLLILGNEGRGLPKVLTDMCSHQVYIGSKRNLNQNIDSMNVSAAAAVILHCLLNGS